MKKIYKYILIIFLTAIISISAMLMYAYIPFFSVSRGEQITTAAKIKSALFVIDIQEGLSGELSTSSYKGYAKQSEQLISNVNKLIESSAKKGIIIVYIYHTDTNPVIKFLTNSHMAANSNAVKIDKRVKIVSPYIFSKHIMDGFSNPDLNRFLIKNKINKIYITGLDAAYCVYKTALGAQSRGYDVQIIRDAVISSSITKKDKMLQKYITKNLQTQNMNYFINH